MTDLLTLIKAVAQEVGDFRTVTATQNSSNNVLVDDMELVQSTDFFRGGQIVFTSGANNGQVRRIIGSDTPSFSVTLNSYLPNPVLAGDTADIYNVGGPSGRPGFLIREYTQAINNAIRDAFPQYREPVTTSFATMGTANGDNRFALPSTMTHVSRVEVLFPSAVFTIAPSRYTDAWDGWWIDRQNRELVLNYDDAVTVGDKTVRVSGYGRPAALVNFTDQTNCDPEWIVEMAKARLLMGQFDQATMAMGQAFANRADQLRSKMAIVTEADVQAI